MATARLLCVGDLHLGRRPSRVPPALLRELGRDAAELGPAEGWRRAVELALAEGVDAVLLAGDVVESEEDFFEAYPQLARGVGRLLAAGVDVVGVAGNHDVRVLPRLAGELPGFTLLGRGGRWASHLVRRGGEPVARVVGWSFPERVVRESPLAGWPQAWQRREFEDGAPGALTTLGLLHADLDAGRSDYAPVRRSELAARGLEGWLVGHVHQPDRAGLAAATPLGYLGTLVGLDPGEPGPRGPWLATLEGGAARLAQVPLAPLRYEALELDAGGLEDAEALEPALVRAIAARHAELAPTLDEALAVALRVRLSGRTTVPARALAERLERAVARGGEPGLFEERGGVRYFVEAARDATRPARPLEELARGSDPVALVARRLLALESGGAECERLVRGAAAELGASRRLQHRNFRKLPPLTPTEESLREALIVAARGALEELLEQREAAEVRAEEPA